MVTTSRSQTATVLSQNDRELVQVLLDDVALIENKLLVALPSPPEIRAMFSPILRKWMLEPQFHRLQKLIRPRTMRFPIIGNGQAVKLCEAGQFEHWMGVMFIGTIGVSTAQVAQKHLGKKPPSPRVPAAVPQLAKHFFGQKMFYWKDAFYTRTDMVKWLANRFGGAHLDFQRADDEAHIDELKNYFGVEITGSNHQMLVGEEIAVARADPQRRPRTYDAAELVAMDTARIFATGVRASEGALATLLVSDNV